jgi:hypothetical protein
MNPKRKKNKKIENFFLWCSADAPEDEAVCLFTGLLANPDVPLRPFPINGLGFGSNSAKPQNLVPFIGT